MKELVSSSAAFYFACNVYYIKADALEGTSLKRGRNMPFYYKRLPCCAIIMRY